jgi:hypothetical protein
MLKFFLSFKTFFWVQLAANSQQMFFKIVIYNVIPIMINAVTVDYSVRKKILLLVPVGFTEH